MSLLSTSDLTYMRDTELTAMSSTAILYRPSYTSSPLGNQTQTFTAFGTVVCDIWPIPRNDREQTGKNQEISEGQFYLSMPYNTAIDVADIVDISSKTYEVTFVPLDQSWLTNLRVEARNYNLSIKTK